MWWREDPAGRHRRLGVAVLVGTLCVARGPPPGAIDADPRDRRRAVGGLAAPRGRVDASCTCPTPRRCCGWRLGPSCDSAGGSPAPPSSAWRATPRGSSLPIETIRHSILPQSPWPLDTGRFLETRRLQRISSPPIVSLSGGLRCKPRCYVADHLTELRSSAIIGGSVARPRDDGACRPTPVLSRSRSGCQCEKRRRESDLFRRRRALRRVAGRRVRASPALARARGLVEVKNRFGPPAIVSAFLRAGATIRGEVRLEPRARLLSPGRSLLLQRETGNINLAMPSIASSRG